MAMSVIKNTGVKRGDKLTSAALNAEFTAVNTAFTMDDDNFRTEAIDQPAFNTNPNHGRSGIILKDANSYIVQSGTLTIQANTNAINAVPQAATEVGAQAVVITANQNDILRVYWQYDFNTTGNLSSPIGVDRQHLCWAMYLEWKTSSGGAYTPVTGQNDLEDTLNDGSTTRYGSISSNLRATSLDYHVIQFRENASDQAVYPGRRMGYGQYFYKFTSDTTLYGLRLVVRGIYEPIYDTTSSNNAIASTQAAGPVHTMVIYRTDLSFLLMRNE
tara:strand:+ start:96 stop:914 length:819 start_codon:yes stop_codon:yes gene_type:complete